MYSMKAGMQKGAKAGFMGGGAGPACLNTEHRLLFLKAIVCHSKMTTEDRDHAIDIDTIFFR
jgi:hypothetical protein